MASSRLERIGTIFTRKQGNERLLRSLSAVITQLEADGVAIKDNELRLQQVTAAHMKCMQQTNAVHKQRLFAIKEIQASFKKQVEGLLTRGAMNAEDRPIWYDVYKKFPPTIEPKFGHPKPEGGPIRPILYEEDIIRANLHSRGLGLGIVNMLNPSGETTTKKLVQVYKQLKDEGVPDDEILEKCAIEVDEMKKSNAATKVLGSDKPQSVTRAVLDEVNIRNIFKEEK